ncbi:hypothetical protein N7455_002328 [Penicillium solitum]|uniref:uncharacterized protein n=1 Tax=Penicillium solitum TaxID=60172 RepID=UPI0032C44B2E|nr:hypothetical protein N7455_002328 [Penicillium solitum]
MSEHIDSQESISKMSTSQSSFVEDLNATQEQSHPSPLQRLKKQWEEIKRSGDLSWRPKRTYMTSTLSHRVVILGKDNLAMDSVFSPRRQKVARFFNPGSAIPNIR